MQNGSYQFEQLESNHLEAKLLADRAQLRLSGFTDLVSRHGFPAQGDILEVGCAHGIRTSLMADFFPESHVIGIDRSPELLKIASHRYSSRSNLSFRTADLYDLPFPDNNFDFIYARLVFMHLKEPILALNNLKRVLRPGGRILIEDADRDCMFFEPAPISFKPFWQKVQEGQRRLGGDPNVGRKLASYLEEVKFNKLQIEPQPIIGSGEEIDFLVKTLMPSLNCYLEAHDRKDGEIAIADLHELSKDPRARLYHFWFVVSGEKC